MPFSACRRAPFSLSRRLDSRAILFSLVWCVTVLYLFLLSLGCDFLPHTHTHTVPHTGAHMMSHLLCLAHVVQVQCSNMSESHAVKLDDSKMHKVDALFPYQ